MAPANEAAGDASMPGPGSGHGPRLRSVRSIDDLRDVDHIDMPGELELVTVAFFLIVVALVVTPLAAVSSAPVLGLLHLWLPRAIVAVFGLAMLRLVIRPFAWLLS